MHNLKELRQNLKVFKKKFKDRNYDFDTDKFSELDKENRELINKKELLEQEKKTISKSKDKTNFDKSKKISNKIQEISQEQKKTQSKIDKIVSFLPNLAKNDVPIGKDEKTNKLIKKVGKIKNFSFDIKSSGNKCLTLPFSKK